MQIATIIEAIEADANSYGDEMVTNATRTQRRVFSLMNIGQIPWSELERKMIELGHIPYTFQWSANDRHPPMADLYISSM